MSFKKYPMHFFIDDVGLIGKWHPPGELDYLGDPAGPKGWLDGGDTPQRNSYYALMAWAQRQHNPDWNRPVEQYDLDNNLKIGRYGFPNTEAEDYFRAMKYIAVGFTFRRYRNPKYWTYDPDRVSRDQFRPTLAANVALGNEEEVERLRKGHAQTWYLRAGNTKWNGATKQNHGQPYGTKEVIDWPYFWRKKKIVKYRDYNDRPADFTGPDVWSIYVRNWKPKCPGLRVLRYLTLCALDIEFVFASILEQTINLKDDDIVNHVVDCVFTHYYAPTIVSWFANRFINNPENIMARVDEYFENDRDYGTEAWFLAEITRKVIPRVMGSKMENRFI